MRLLHFSPVSIRTGTMKGRIAKDDSALEWPIFAQTASFCRNLNNHATNEEERCSCVEYVNL